MKIHLNVSESDGIIHNRRKQDVQLVGGIDTLHIECRISLRYTSSLRFFQRSFVRPSRGHFCQYEITGRVENSSDLCVIGHGEVVFADVDGGKATTDSGAVQQVDFFGLGKLL